MMNQQFKMNGVTLQLLSIKCFYMFTASQAQVHELSQAPPSDDSDHDRKTLKTFKAVVGTFYYFWSIDYIGIYTLQSCASNNDWQICNAKYGDYSTFGDGLFGVNKND